MAECKAGRVTLGASGMVAITEEGSRLPLLKRSVSDRDASIARMENTASKNEINVEASHSTPKHISDPMKVEGTIDGWPLSNPTFTRRRAPISVGRVAIFRGAHGSWGPHLEKGQVVVLEVEVLGTTKVRRYTARVERFMSASTRTSRYHRGASTPLPSSYVVLVDSIIELERVR